MSGLSFGGTASCTPSIIPAPANAVEPIVTNDGWFPDVDPAQLRGAYRIRDSVTRERLREAILNAIVTVGNDLAAWRTANEADSASLAAVPAVRIGGESRLLMLYRRAIGSYVKAEVVERNRDIDTTGPGLARAADLEPTVDELRRDGLHAIRDILGRSRTTVDLL